MSDTIGTFFYQKTIKRYLVMVAEIFRELQVQAGYDESNNPKYMNVPVMFGSKDRVTSAILSENTQNKPLRIPLMSLHMTGLELAPELRHGVGMSRTVNFVPNGGIVPNDIQSINQLMPQVYKMNIQLSLFCSNQDTHFQLLEQILVLFNPTLQLQISDTAMDWTKLTNIELTGINLTETYPMATDRRYVTSDLTFSLPIYLSIPNDTRLNVVKNIFLRIGAINESTAFEDNPDNPYIGLFDDISI
jgi:hypothetical protein